MTTRQERILARRVMAVLTEVEHVLRRNHNVKWFRLKKEDEIRLLRLKQWEEKYRVSISYILGKLIPFWTQKYAKYSKAVFGTTISTLVGSVSEKVLQEAVAKDYPDGENEKRWKAMTQQRQWARIWDGPRKENWQDPIQAVREYRNRMKLERADRKSWARKLARRKYQGNPW